MDKATVAIIGGGFSGTVAAIRLLTATRDGSPSLPFGSRVVLDRPFLVYDAQERSRNAPVPFAADAGL